MPDLLVPVAGDEPQLIVVRGQHRLSSGQLVRVTNPAALQKDSGEPAQAAQVPVRPTTSSNRS